MIAALLILSATTISSPGLWRPTESGWLPRSVSSSDTPGSDDYQTNAVKRLSPTGHAMGLAISEGWAERTCYPALTNPAPIEASSRRVLGFARLKRAADGILGLATRGFVDDFGTYTVYWSTTAHPGGLPPDVDYPIPTYYWTPVDTELLYQWVNAGLIFQGAETDGVYRASRPHGDTGWVGRYMFPRKMLVAHDLDSEWDDVFSRQLEHSFVDNVNSNFAHGVAASVTNLTRRIVLTPLAALNQAEATLDRTYSVGEVTCAKELRHLFTSHYQCSSSPVTVWISLPSTYSEGDLWDCSPVFADDLSWGSTSGDRLHSETPHDVSPECADWINVTEGAMSMSFVVSAVTGEDSDPPSRIWIWDVEDMVSEMLLNMRTVTATNVMYISQPIGSQPISFVLNAGGGTVEYASPYYVDGFEAQATGLATIDGSYRANLADTGAVGVPPLPPGKSAYDDGVVKSADVYSLATVASGGDSETNLTLFQSSDTTTVASTNEYYSYAKIRTGEIRARITSDQMSAMGHRWDDTVALPDASDLRAHLRGLSVGGVNSVGVDFHMPEIRVIFGRDGDIRNVEERRGDEWVAFDIWWDGIPINASTTIGGTNITDSLQASYDGRAYETLTTKVDWQFNYIRRGSENE